MSHSYVPQSVYAYVVPMKEDPLPAGHIGDVYHYTGLSSLHGVIENGVLFASHAQDLNDPTEREYGWKVIGERLDAVRLSDPARELLEEAFAYAPAPGDWFPNPFVLSASSEPDSLTQYRLYGQYAVTLAGGVWTAAPPDEPDIGEAFRAVWRPVLYGPDEARPYVDRMLEVAAALIDDVPFSEDPAQYGDAVLTMLETLALHIKDENFRDEHEVRLVFSVPTVYPGATHVRVAADDRLVTYVKSRPLDEEATGHAVRAVRLGPLAGAGRTVEAIQQHFLNHSRIDRRYMNALATPGKLPVTGTNTRLVR